MTRKWCCKHQNGSWKKKNITRFPTPDLKYCWHSCLNMLYINRYVSYIDTLACKCKGVDWSLHTGPAASSQLLHLATSWPACYSLTDEGMKEWMIFLAPDKITTYTYTTYFFLHHPMCTFFKDSTPRSGWKLRKKVARDHVDPASRTTAVRISLAGIYTVSGCLNIDYHIHQVTRLACAN